MTGPHIVAHESKDLNLERVEHNTMYNITQVWMKNDPFGAKGPAKNSRSALAFLSLPGPAIEVPAWQAPRVVPPTEAALEASKEGLDYVFDQLDAGNPVKQPDVWGLREKFLLRWKNSYQPVLRAKNRHNAQRFRASLKIIQSDYTAAPAPIPPLPAPVTTVDMAAAATAAMESVVTASLQQPLQACQGPIVAPPPPLENVAAQAAS